MDVSFKVGDKVFFKVSPWKMIIRFILKGKLSLRFIEPYEILEPLPPELSKIHNVFHVSMLRKYHSNFIHMVPLESLEVESNQSYEEELVHNF
ncbi:Gag protease polyprotein [Gossypium australe]|uniref:Gag protease polyprotein n=1 Tax=Gossypium australe TaxID=47621 RepID=A0A5B6WQ44_9ROSI|nr:Gag protease polyprotein [Gossypium australe]